MTRSQKKPGAYLPRILDEELPLVLEAMGATAIFGLRGSGAVTTARQYARSETVIGQPPISFDFERWRAVERQILEGEPPRLVRDWSRQPAVWDLVRRAVDNRHVPGQFLLTTRVHPPRGSRIHPGTGRYAVRRMRPMTLFEQGYSTGSVSLDRLLDLDEPDPHAPTRLSPAGYLQRILTGGWPALAGASPAAARRYVADYLERLIGVELPETLGRRVNPQLARAYLSAHARAIGRPATTRRILDQARHRASAGRDRVPSARTARGYYEALERLMVIDDLYLGWSQARIMVPNLADPSLAANLLGHTTTKSLKADPDSLRATFAALALRDLTVYAQHHNVYVSAWPGLTSELPVYVLRRDLDPGLTLALAANSTQIAVAVRELRERREQRPAGLHAVLTRGSAVRHRDQRIWEIPLSCLGP